MDLIGALKENGAEIFVAPFGSLFDVVARMDKYYVIKLLKNIDALTQSQAEQLANFSKIIEANPVVVGDRTSSGQLDDGKTYIRHSISCMNQKTFLNMIHGELILQKTKGGEVILIDPTKMRIARKKKGLSMSELARIMGVSKETIYRYEKGHILPNAQRANLLIDLLGKDILHVESKKQIGGFQLYEFKRSIVRIGARDKYKVIFGFRMDNLEPISKLSNMVEALYAVVTDKKSEASCKRAIYIEELKDVESEDELLELLV